MAEMTEAAREARNAYNRAYYARNREKVKEAKARYWARKAAEQADSERKKAEESGRGGAQHDD